MLVVVAVGQALKQVLLNLYPPMPFVDQSPFVSESSVWQEGEVTDQQVGVVVEVQLDLPYNK
jgi:hypothetical protein